MATIAAVVLLAAGYLFYRNMGANDPARGLPGQIPCVCVATGEIFYIDREDLTRLPAENPKTKERTLVPVAKREDGSYRVSSQSEAIVRSLGEKNKYVDLKTFVVKK
ncbi:MAG: hypothetical protein D6744_15420 [Planctomycetota bacterium]|nr:MAG: hypothetical protein D6744_15420 [Planctomycetota bacterium]